MKKTLMLALAACQIATLSPLYAGQLSDFEKKATQPDKDKPNKGKPAVQDPHRHAVRPDNDLCSMVDDPDEDFVASLLWQPVCLVFSGMHGLTQARVAPEPGQFADVAPRQAGEADLPFIRLDLHGQHLDDSRIDGIDGRLEVGYGAFAVQSRYTHYNDEADAREWLDLSQNHLLYRFSMSPAFELGMGVGWVKLRGRSGAHEGDSWTLPLNIRVADNIALRLRPAWHSINGNAINDYDGAIAFEQPFYALQLGYRSLRVSGSHLSGAYVGVGMFY